MTFISDLLLRNPYSDLFGDIFLFFNFFIHMTFILALLGTAIIGLYILYHSLITRENFELRWDKQVHKTFLIPKGIGVVWGVGTLLVIQSHYAVPFFSAVALFPGWWMLAILLMIVSFFMIDGISHTLTVHKYVSVTLGTLGLIILLFVPAIFVLILVTTENSAYWPQIVQRGYHLPATLAVHWLFRYLHVIGGAIVVGAVFHYYVTSHGHEYRKREMMQWIMAGLLIQFLTGGLLTLTLQDWIDRWVLLPFGLGILAAVTMAWFLYHGMWYGRDTEMGITVLFLPLIVLGMLLTRQYIQQQKLHPLQTQIEKVAQAREAILAPYETQEIAAIDANYRTIYNNGRQIFDNACAYCHGLDGATMPQGQHFAVPPEKISQVRASRAYLYDILKHGVPGAAMPYFSIYNKTIINDIIDHLDKRFAVLGPVQSTPDVDDQTAAQADLYFNSTCAICHGTDGAVAEYGKQFQPPPPDFRQFALTPPRAAEVIRNGYPGTAMRPFNLPENLIQALVKKEISFHQPQ